MLDGQILVTCGFTDVNMNMWWKLGSNIVVVIQTHCGSYMAILGQLIKCIVTIIFIHCKSFRHIGVFI